MHYKARLLEAKTKALVSTSSKNEKMLHKCMMYPAKTDHLIVTCSDKYLSLYYVFYNSKHIFIPSLKHQTDSCYKHQIDYDAE